MSKKVIMKEMEPSPNLFDGNPATSRDVKQAINQIAKLSIKSSRHSKWMIVLTIFIVILTIALVCLTVHMINIQ